MATNNEIEKLEELIKDSIGGDLLEQQATSLLPPGENYGSVMYKVDFKVKKNGEVKEYHAVAKCCPINELTQKMFNTQETFKSEIAWYTTVIPTIKEYVRTHGNWRKLDFFQEFYGARISLDPTSDRVDLNAVILTENLKHRGFANEDRHVGFDSPTTFAILEDLATFHAIPLAIRLQDPKLFEQKLVPYCPCIGDFDESKENFDNMVLEVFERIPELREHIERFREIFRVSFPFKKKELREPWTSIVHLDMWCNNIMIKGGERPKVIFLDLQVPMVASPARDLIFFLLTSVNFPGNDTQLDDYIRFYYDEFVKNLKHLDVDTSAYTFEGLLKEIEIEMKTSEFLHALNHSMVILMEKGVSAIDTADGDFSQEKLDKFEVKVNDRQIAKFRWIAEEALKRRWI